MKKRIHIFYSGRVQGVGFRFTAESLARDLGIFGWVKNTSDGRVEVLAEAKEEILKDFLARIQENFGRYISNVEEEWLPASGEFRDFRIEF